jgi:hypothetical protein
LPGLTGSAVARTCITCIAGASAQARRPALSRVARCAGGTVVVVR